MHWCLQSCYASQYEGTTTPVQLTPHHSLAHNLGKDRVKLSRDITLPTKVRLVKAMVFPVAMCGCKSWTIKKAESRRIDAFEL